MGILSKEGVSKTPTPRSRCSCDVDGATVQFTVDVGSALTGIRFEDIERPRIARARSPQRIP